VKETVLKRLLEPHPYLPRKRVTIYDRPVDPAGAAQWADRQRSIVATSHGQKAAARESSTLQAEANARDEARGASVERFAVITTITVTDEAQLRRAVWAWVCCCPITSRCRRCSPIGAAWTIDTVAVSAAYRVGLSGCAGLRG
jgi:hypothetical protein